MNKNFPKKFKEVKKLMKKSLYKDDSWVKEVSKGLEQLKKIWPDDLSQREISDLINETIFDIDVIEDFSNFKKEKLEHELTSHGNMQFYFLSQYLPVSEVEEYIEDLSESKTKNLGSNYIVSKLIKSINERTKKQFKRTSDEEMMKIQLDSLDFSIWSFILEDCKIWLPEESFVEIIKKHSNKKSNFSKKEAVLVHEVLSRYVKNGYFNEAVEPKAKVELYKDLDEMLR